MKMYTYKWIVNECVSAYDPPTPHTHSSLSVVKGFGWAPTCGSTEVITPE